MNIYLIIILVTLLFFTAIGVKFRKLTNPVFLFNTVWLVCFGLYSLQLSRFYQANISSRAFLTFELYFIGFNSAFYIGLYTRHLRIINALKLIKRPTKYEYIKALFYIWSFLTFLEVLYCKGFPLLWKILGRSGSYATFGIPSVHGFINSLSWFIISISYIYYLDSKDDRVIRFIIATNIIYVLLLARQSMITEVIQLTTIFILKRKVKIKRIASIVIVTIFIFGLVGNVRTDPRHVLATSGLSNNAVPNILMGFIWVYLYMMTPVANMISFIDKNTVFMHGKAMFSAILPTAISNALGLTTKEDFFYLISQTYNVSSSLLTPFKDFGIIGTTLFAIFIGNLGAKYWRDITFENYSDRSVCNYSIYAGITALTFFANMLFSLPIIIQFFYVNILFRNYFDIDEQYGESL